MSFFEKHKKGIVGTTIFHIIILIWLILGGFFTPLPLPGEEGILVNFGTSSQGLGELEPRSQRQSKSNPPPTIKEKKKPTPPPQEPAAPKPTPVKKAPAKEVAMTQDYEKTAAIDAAEQKRQQEKVEQEKREQQKLLEQKRIEQKKIEKQRQEELRRKQKEEAERKKKEEEQRKIAEINSLTKGAFSNTENSNGTGKKGTNDSQNQGVTFPGGNQGVPTGDPSSKNYGQGGSGSGRQGNGISYSLSGRTAKTLPKPVYPGNDQGVVVVKVTVDKNGNVTNAEPGARGTTIMNKHFWNEAKKAALKAKFNVDGEAPAFQQGTISYRFRLS